MCITFFRIARSIEKSRFPFVIAFNRDEMTDRLSEKAQFLTDQGMKNVVCGIDSQTNGTWFAYNKLTGDVCFLTNFRNPLNYSQKKRYNSRGFLVIDYVKINDPTITDKPYDSIESYEKNLVGIDTRGFNIIYGNIQKLEFNYYQYQNNPNQRAMIAPIKLQQGKTYGLANGSLDEWDKAIRGKNEFGMICNQYEEEVKRLSQNTDRSHELDQMMNRFSEDLFTLMQNDQKPIWRNVQSGKGYPKYWEHINSSVFVRNNLFNFCTVSTSCLIFHSSGQTLFKEQRYRHYKDIWSKLFGTLSVFQNKFDIDSVVNQQFKSFGM